jgi:hypothetical protein
MELKKIFTRSISDEVLDFSILEIMMLSCRSTISSMMISSAWKLKMELEESLFSKAVALETINEMLSKTLLEVSSEKVNNFFEEK